MRAFAQNYFENGKSVTINLYLYFSSNTECKLRQSIAELIAIVASYLSVALCMDTAYHSQLFRSSHVIELQDFANTSVCQFHF